MKKLTTEEFIAKARVVHGERYDYSQVVYLRKEIKVKIKCKEHGIFEQSPSNHSSGNGCPKCHAQEIGSKKQLTLSNLIQKASIVHGNKYQYLSNDTHTQGPMISIICPEHGGFYQSVYDHLKGCRCPECGGVKRKDTASFIKQAKMIHGEKYNYTESVYVNAFTKVSIICPVHGKFEQTPTAHTGKRKSGCHKCSNRYSLTTREFIKRAKEVHGNLYDYTDSFYKNALTKIKILCPNHGVFEQIPHNHLWGAGCPVCARGLWLETNSERVGILYLIKIFSSTEEFYKIGITMQSVRERYKGGFANTNYNYEVIVTYNSNNLCSVFDWEQSILETFAYLTYKPLEYFAGYTECFSSCEEILACFPSFG